MSEEKIVPVELMGVEEQLQEHAGFWRSCSGCLETEDGHPVGEYPYSEILKCTLGGGCRECGGIGAIWDDTDYSELGVSVDDEPTSPQQQESEEKDSDAENESLRAEVVSLNARLNECTGGTKRDLAKKLEQQQEKNARLAQQLAAANGLVERLREIGTFLLGEGKLDGRSFGELVTDIHDGIYFWRKHLRATLSDLPYEVPSFDERSSEADKEKS